jgi:cysteinyl-tRNA synthetase
MAGEKMSKSLGNLAFVDDLLERHDPRSIRKLLLRHHYREDWAFDEGDLTLGSDVKDGPATREAFFQALDEDLDTPRALRVLDRARQLSALEDRALVGEARDLLGLSLDSG